MQQQHFAGGAQRPNLGYKLCRAPVNMMSEVFLHERK